MGNRAASAAGEIRSSFGSLFHTAGDGAFSFAASRLSTRGALGAGHRSRVNGRLDEAIGNSSGAGQLSLLSDISYRDSGFPALGETGASVWPADPSGPVQDGAHRSRGHSAPWAQLALLTDALMLAMAGYAVQMTSASGVSGATWTISTSALTLAILAMRGMYGPPPYAQRVAARRTIVTSTALATTILISARAVFTRSPLTASEAVSIWVVGIAFLTVGRGVLTASTRRASRAGHTAGARTLIIGAGQVGRLVATRLLAHPEIGLRPVGFLDKEPLYHRDGSAGLTVLGANWDLERIAAENAIEHVVVTFSTAPNQVLLRLLQRCQQLGIRTSFVPRLYEQTTERFTIQRLGALPLFSSRFSDPKGWQFTVKYAFDRIAAALLLMVLAPLMAALALAVRISAGRPILYRQKRVGRDGRHFEMVKFRSMRAPAAPAADLVVNGDTAPGGVVGQDRRTRVGKALRRTSLDELPQLFNVMKGDMSLVGPRPERPEFVEIFEQTVYRYGERHRVKSGITGWAQVNGLRGKTSLADRIEWDNYYIENWSLWFDFKIMVLTFAAVVPRRGVE